MPNRTAYLAAMRMSAVSDKVTEMNRRQSRNPDYVRDFFSQVLTPAEAMIFVKYRDEIRDRRVLDVGSGAGRITRYLARWTPHAMGMDFSQPMLDYCHRALPHIKFI